MAEKYVFETMLVQAPDVQLTILTIVDKDWSVMTGDDWLNSSGTRNRFIDYVDEQLSREVNEDWNRIRATYTVSENIRFMKVAGDIEETIAEVAEELHTDLVVLGGFMKKPFRLTSVKMTPGLAARISNEKLHPLLPCPLLTVT